MKLLKKVLTKFNRTDSTLISFILVLLYISYINLFVLSSTPEIIFLQFSILVIVYQKIRRKEFLRSWLPFIGFFLLFEFLRGIADNLSPFYKQVLYWCYDIEVLIFNKLPTLYIQEHIGTNQIVLNISLFFYMAFFYYSFLIAYLLWLKKPSLFQKYTRGFLILTYVGLIIFFILPTAPPWFVNEIKNLGIVRLMHYKTIIYKASWLSLYKYFAGGNAVAAMPSLHAAWPMFTSLFLIKNLKRTIYFFLLIVPLGVGFSVIYTGEHYVIDVLAGWLIAFIIVIFQK